MIWLVLIGMLAMAIAAMIYPFARRTVILPSARIEYDIAVYRNQLAEIEQDVERGLMSAEQAGAARTEIHRRMLAAEDAEFKQTKPPALNDVQGARWIGIAAVVVVLGLGSIVMYMALGSPFLPGKPYADRQKTDPDFIKAAEAEKLAAQLEKSPNAEAYFHLAQLYIDTSQYEKAVAAYRRDLELGENDPAIWSGLGESLVMANDGMVTPESVICFVKTLKQDPGDPRARFYIGLAEAQIGNARKAVAIWRDLEQTNMSDTFWRHQLHQHTAALAKQGGFKVEDVTPEPPSPTLLDAMLAGMMGPKNKP
jgi:cytochrome c-type biogenesis protein CcmH